MHKVPGIHAKLLFCVALLLAIPCFASDWQMIGPEGGNVRSLAYDPSNPGHILLGTSVGQIFASQDGGTSWEMFAHLGSADDYVIDHIVFDPTNPATIFAAGWGLFHDSEGDVFRSDDGGHTWRALEGAHGKSIRAFAMSPSDHNTLVFGALDGVFRSRDGGATWARMTPENPEVLENHSSMKNFVSVAVDPQNPDIVYAGTRHLAWKTTDAGEHWHNTKDGMLDDSDVFSIIVDPKTPSRVYASACSGIYRSDNGADLFHRVQGLPHSAIRTRVLKQDPVRPSIVYAGTTGGLWKTVDGGVKWALVSSADVIVNDVLIDPRNPDRVLLATDLRGVLASDDGFVHNTASNRGFSRRVVGALVVDQKNPTHLYAGVANDRAMGGLFVSEDSGKSWRQSSRGLADRDILTLQQSSDGVLFAGTNHGILFLPVTAGSWQPASMIAGPMPQGQPAAVAPQPVARKGKAPAAKPKTPSEPVIPDATAPRVRALQIGENVWYAATNEGLFLSVDHGRKWYRQDVEGERDFKDVSGYEDGTATLIGHKGGFISRDWGKTWKAVTLPWQVTELYSLTSMPDSSIWLGSHEGALRSADGGNTWRPVTGGLPKSDVLAVRYDAESQRLLATTQHGYGVFESRDLGKTWQKAPDAPFIVRWAMNYQGRLLAGSAYNGLLLQGDVSATAASTR